MADLNTPQVSYIGKVADALGPFTADLKDKGFDPSSRMGGRGDDGSPVHGNLNKLP